ncbi:MAG: ABC transporter ATP-binding protein [Deltaproteobacteria bacterium]|nr:ABC transporter ATP-binding protein [Deltaproteobacteria bacterium]
MIPTPSNSAAIDVRGFKKTFYVGVRRRASEAVQEISFRVEPGEIFGFLGPNGAGKTTTIKALLGLIRPDAGELELLGHPVRSLAWRAEVGYLPEHPNFYEYLTGLELVTWFGRLAGLSHREAERSAKRQLERVGLGAAMTRRLRGYSKGMLQRAGLAQALVGAPKLLILDEPMTGLDPIGRRDIRELILELRREGCTIFYSTHILPDVEMTCDRVAIIHQGRVQRTGLLEEILRETTRAVSVRLGGLSPAQVERLKATHTGATVAQDALQIDLPDSELARQLVAEELANGAKLLGFEPHRDDLETIFLRALGGARAHQPHLETTP